ncbi:MAG: hypothetical protein R3246_06730 [Acidimicrobiia bacterium]|nr:hypothetical protein [Acidimicrobiia bacterium]
MLQRHETPAPSMQPAVIGLIGDDLPCPWCGQATAETDDHCAGCGRRFG